MLGALGTSAPRARDRLRDPRRRPRRRNSTRARACVRSSRSNEWTACSRGATSTPGDRDRARDRRGRERRRADSRARPLLAPVARTGARRARSERNAHERLPRERATLRDARRRMLSRCGTSRPRRAPHREARRLEPASPAGTIVLGRILLAEGKSDSAEMVLQESRALHPDEPSVLHLLARAQIDRDHIEDAHATLVALARVSPSDIEARRLLHELETEYPELVADALAETKSSGGLPKAWKFFDSNAQAVICFPSFFDFSPPKVSQAAPIDQPACATALRSRIGRAPSSTTAIRRGGPMQNDRRYSVPKAVSIVASPRWQRVLIASLACAALLAVLGAAASAYEVKGLRRGLEQPSLPRRAQ